MIAQFYTQCSFRRLTLLEITFPAISWGSRKQSEEIQPLTVAHTPSPGALYITPGVTLPPPGAARFLFPRTDGGPGGW